jgi:hypothetical protein
VSSACGLRLWWLVRVYYKYFMGLYITENRKASKNIHMASTADNNINYEYIDLKLYYFN